MFTTSILKKFFQAGQPLALACAFTTLFIAGAAYADAYSPVSTYALQQALTTNDHVDLYNSKQGGFNLNSSYFSGLASGVAPSTNTAVADFNNDQRLYALLVDGRYDFNHEALNLSSPVHPYVSGGMGMATVGSNNIAAGSEMVPLFRLGGGVAYRLGEQWNMSLDYKNGIAAPTAGDQVFTGRGQQAVDLQQLNLGMSYAF